MPEDWVFDWAVPDEVEPWFFEGVDRVVMVTAWLDLHMASLVGSLAPTGGEAGKELFALASVPGGPLRRLRTIASQLPRGAFPTEVRGISQGAEVVIAERNRITHSMLTSEEHARHPRKALPDVAMHDPLPTAEELRALEERVRPLIIRVVHAAVASSE